MCKKDEVKILESIIGEEVRLEAQMTNSRQVNCNENFIYVFLFWELHGLSPLFLYIPRSGPHIWRSKTGRPILEIYKSLTDRVYDLGERTL